MTDDELREDIAITLRAMTAATEDHYQADTVLVSWSMAEALASYQAAAKGLRRTAGGLWTVDGRRYRSKALALASLWPMLLGMERRR